MRSWLLRGPAPGPAGRSRRGCPLIPGRGACLLAALALSLWGSGARAGSVTADSIWDQDHARQEALQRVPKGAEVTGSRCQEIGVGMNNYRYRCTVDYAFPPAGGSGAQPQPANPTP